MKIISSAKNTRFCHYSLIGCILLGALFYLVSVGINALEGARLCEFGGNTGAMNWNYRLNLSSFCKMGEKVFNVRS